MLQTLRRMEVWFALPPQMMHGDDLANIMDLWITAIYNHFSCFAKKQGVPMNELDTSKNVLPANKGFQNTKWKYREEESHTDTSYYSFLMPLTSFIQYGHTAQSLSVEILFRYKSLWWRGQFLTVFRINQGTSLC